MSQNVSREGLPTFYSNLISLIETTEYSEIRDMVCLGKIELSSIIKIIEQTPSLQSNHTLNLKVMQLVLDIELNLETFKTQFITLWKLNGSQIKDCKKLMILRLLSLHEQKKLIPCARMLISVLGRETFSKLIAKNAELTKSCSFLLQDKTELDLLLNKAFNDFAYSKHSEELLSLLENGIIDKISQNHLLFLSKNLEHFCFLLAKVVFLENAKGVVDQLLQFDPQYVLGAAQEILRMAIRSQDRLYNDYAYSRILLLLLNRYGFYEFNKIYPPDACSNFLKELSSKNQDAEKVDWYNFTIIELFEMAVHFKDDKSCNEILCNYNEKYLLFLAASKMGKKTIVEQLLNSGIDINVVSTKPIKKLLEGKTALDYACESGHLDTVVFLLEKGASTASRGGRFLFSKVSGGRNGKEIRKLLITKNAINIKEVDKDGYTVLHLACSYNDIEIVKQLIENDADLLAKNNEDETALYLACRWGCTRCVLSLLEGAKQKGLETLRNLVIAQTKSGKTILHEMLSFKLIKDLLNYAQNIEEQTPGFLKLFLNIKDEKENTALHYTARTSKSKIVKLLIEKGANIKAQNLKKQTPLHLACQHLSLKRFAFDLVMADLNLETLTIKDCHGQIPLDILAAHAKSSFLQLFSKLGKEEGMQNQIPFQQISLSSYIKGIERLNRRIQKYDDKLKKLIDTSEMMNKENEQDKEKINIIRGMKGKLEKTKKATEKKKENALKQLELLIELPVEKLVRENLSLTLSLIKIADRKDETISTEVHKYIYEKLKNEEEKIEFLQLSCQNEILFNYLLDPRTYADLVQREVARLAEDQKLHFLALLPPLQIAEIINNLDKKARERLLQKEITCELFDEHTLSVVEALCNGKNEWLDQMNAENFENLLPYLEQLLKIIPLSSLAAAAASDLKNIVIAYLRVCNQSQIKVIIPQLSDEDFIQGIKELPHQFQFDCLRAALPSQKKSYLGNDISSPLSKTCGEDYKQLLSIAKEKCAEVLTAFKKNEQIQAEYEELEALLNKMFLDLTHDCQILESFLKLLKKAYLENYQEAEEVKAIKTEKKLLAKLKKNLKQLKKLIKKLKTEVPVVKVKNEAENVPDEFCDFTFTSVIMENPVQTPHSAQNYERKDLENWVRDHSTDPITRFPMTIKDIKSNDALKKQIAAWKKSKEQQKAEKEEKAKEKVKD